jgi:tRNA dimethylallyltransferase
VAARCVALVGATASGKSGCAIEVARARCDVEIVSVDSMAVYREMDLGTAKPSKQVLAAIPHHMIDVLDPSQECTVSWFQSSALAAIDEIRSRGKVPLLVGGTGLYHRAVVDELTIPAQYLAVRVSLEAEASTTEGRARLYQELLERDPPAAARIGEENTRRIVRALEVVRGSGRRFSSFGPGLEHYGDGMAIQIGLDAEIEVLDAAVADRVEVWIEQGFVEEVRALATRSQGLSRTAAQAIGYRELLEWLEKPVGTVPLGTPVEATVARTRALLRRQRSWFRRDPRITWATSPAAASELVDQAIERVGAAIG